MLNSPLVAARSGARHDSADVHHRHPEEVGRRAHRVRQGFRGGSSRRKLEDVRLDLAALGLFRSLQRSDWRRLVLPFPPISIPGTQ